MVHISTKNKWRSLIVIIILIGVVVVNGRSIQGAKPVQEAVKIKAMQVVKKDAIISYEFTGGVEARNEVPIQAKVSGNIVEKMVMGGAVVSKGQPLFRIDSRQYEATFHTAQAQLAQAEALLSNSHTNTVRYEELSKKDAISQQIVDTQVSTEQQNLAAVNAYRGSVETAEANLQDTLIVSPIDGRIDISDLSIGNYVAAGSTKMATISSVDPVMVKFSMSENEYLKFVRLQGTSDTMGWGRDLHLILSDGLVYPLTGQLEQVNNGLATGTGTLALKATFPNPNKFLVPGMFARVVVQGEVRPGALLIPQRAVQQLLDKTTVTVIGEDDKVESRWVKMGPKIGMMWVVEEGLTENDRVVVEGFLKIQPGNSVNVIMIGPDELEMKK